MHTLNEMGGLAMKDPEGSLPVYFREFIPWVGERVVYRLDGENGELEFVYYCGRCEQWHTDHHDHAAMHQDCQHVEAADCLRCFCGWCFDDKLRKSELWMDRVAAVNDAIALSFAKRLRALGLNVVFEPGKGRIGGAGGLRVSGTLVVGEKVDGYQAKLYMYRYVLNLDKPLGGLRPTVIIHRDNILGGVVDIVGVSGILYMPALRLDAAHIISFGVRVFRDSPVILPLDRLTWFPTDEVWEPEIPEGVF